MTHFLTVFVQNKCTRDHFSRETHKATLCTLSKMLETSKLKIKGIHKLYVACIFLEVFSHRKVKVEMV